MKDKIFIKDRMKKQKNYPFPETLDFEHVEGNIYKDKQGVKCDLLKQNHAILTVILRYVLFIMAKQNDWANELKDADQEVLDRVDMELRLALEDSLVCDEENLNKFWKDKDNND
ncbi:MAG: hypothetical protein Q4F84_07385 [Fibrobacter sp.]|nr:hypothetical protein [Fibrobacter sp.]